MSRRTSIKMKNRAEVLNRLTYIIRKVRSDIEHIDIDGHMPEARQNMLEYKSFAIWTLDELFKTLYIRKSEYPIKVFEEFKKMMDDFACEHHVFTISSDVLTQVEDEIYLRR